MPEQMSLGGMPEPDESPESVYKSLVWLLDNHEFGPKAKWRREKIESLTEWYDEKGFFTEKQVEFALKLIREGDPYDFS